MRQVLERGDGEEEAVKVVLHVLLTEKRGLIRGPGGGRKDMLDI